MKKLLFILSVLVVNLGLLVFAFPANAQNDQQAQQNQQEAQTAESLNANANYSANYGAMGSMYSTMPTDTSMYGYNPGPYMYVQTLRINTPWGTTVQTYNYPLYYFPMWTFAGTGLSGQGANIGGGFGGGLGVPVPGMNLGGLSGLTNPALSGSSAFAPASSTSGYGLGNYYGGATQGGYGGLTQPMYQPGISSFAAPSSGYGLSGYGSAYRTSGIYY